MARKKSTKQNMNAWPQAKSTPLVAPMATVANRRVQVKARVPKIQMAGDGLTVKNKEFFSNVSAATAAATVGRVGLNPADPNVFGWLSSIALNYTYYRWKRLKVMFASQTSTTTAGSITLGLFYDREDLDSWFGSASPTTYLTQVVGASQGPFWGSTISCLQNGEHSAQIQAVADVDMAHMRTKWHIIDGNTGGTAVDNQAVAVFLGNVQSSAGASLTVGTLWFEYEIELRHPTFHNPTVALRTLGQGSANRSEKEVIERPREVVREIPDAPPKVPPTPPPSPTN